MKRLLALAAALLILSGCTTAPNMTVPSTGATTETTAPVTTQPTTAPETTVPETSAPPEPTVPPTTVPPTTAPPATTAPVVTAPPVSNEEMIGSLYTRTELEAIDNTNFGCGFGGQTDEHGRPVISISYDEKYEKYDAHFIGPDDGSIYLTFTLGYEHTVEENGQSVRLTERMLDILKEKDVKAIFLINGHYAKSCPDIVQRMIDEGHIVGSHSYGHYTLAELSIDRVVEEIMLLHDYVMEHFGYKMTLFRPPSGESSERVLAIAQSLGYTTVNYSFAYYDWDTNDQPDPASSLQNMINKAHSGGIIQLHCVSYTNAQILADAIDGIRAKGLEFDLFG